MPGFWAGFPAVEAGLRQVRARLQDQSRRLPGEIRRELDPLLARPGKNLRAGLVLLAAGGGAERPAVLAAAATVELLHLATLVHDDIVDQAALRRGEPALHRTLGASRAVLYGDLLFAASFREASRDLAAESSRALADLVTVMAATEILQLNGRFEDPASPRRTLRRSLGKTALLFSLSAFVGAREGGRPEALALPLRRAGYALGMAFQLQDDLLDWTGDPAVLGKPVLEDVRLGIYTWPVALAWREDTARTRRELADLRGGTLAPEALRDRWTERGLWERAGTLVLRYVDRAARDLDRALGPGSPERRDWSRVLSALVALRG